MHERIEPAGCAIAQVIGAGPYSPEAETANRWRLHAPDQTAATLSLDEGWLTIEAPVETVHAADPDSRMGWWHCLPGAHGRSFRRPVHRGNSPGLCYRSEMFLDPDQESGPELGARVREFVARFFAATSDGFSNLAEDTLHAGDPTLSLSRLCRQAELECSLSSDTEGVVEWMYLPGRSREDRAWVERMGDAVRLQVEVGRAPGLPEGGSSDSHEAVALMLLTVCGMVRLLGVSVNEVAGQFRVRLDTLLPSVATALDLSQALGALSTGLDLAKAETGVLSHEHIASSYLARYKAFNSEPKS